MISLFSRCQAGYGTDGQFCLECPEGKTCSRTGAVACDGQCEAGVRSECYGAIGFARCDAVQKCVIPGMLGATVRRGTYVNPGEGAECATYITCNAGYFKRFLQRVECVPCVGKPALSRFVTAGLSTNDGSSCLWECSYGTQQNIKWNASAGACVAGAMLAAAPAHGPGEFGSRGTGVVTCPAGFTSEASTGLTSGACLACPLPPASARSTVASRGCEWECYSGDWTRRGVRCVAAGCDAGAAGWTLAAGGGCVPSTVPWNRAGTRKVAPLVTVATGGSGVWTSLATLTASSKGWGVYGRHAVTMQPSGRVVTTAGRMCSTTLAWLGGRQYLIGAVCNQSFLAYVDVWSSGAGVLIGQASSPGWADGFRTQARFQTELYVATGGDSNASVWVLDRWNCVVREVALWPQPGDYRTRVYTVHGVTSRLQLTGQPQCYGGGSLASPRRFWEVGQGVLLFTDDNGLWQLELGSGALSPVMGEAWDLGRGFEADDLLGVQLLADGRYTLRLGFRDGATWVVTAKAEACPDGTTSLAGGDCIVGCEWRADGRGYYVNASSGGCVACDAGLQCAAGFEAVGCTRAAQSRCSPCPALGARRAYVVAGRCDADLVRYLAPDCPAGSYADAGGVCETCPAGGAARTALPGATRVEQCKCSTTAGLRRRKRDGACVSISGGLQAYGAEGWCAVGCNVPPNATLWRDAGCQWRCDVGLYHDTEAPWLGKCKECVRVAGSNETWLAMGTRGDDDAPLSCEFIWKNGTLAGPPVR